MPAEWGDRQTFLPKDLEYVGSFSLTSCGYQGVAPAQATLAAPDPKVKVPTTQEFFNVLRAATVSVGGRERDCPTGKIAYVFERLVLRSLDGLVDLSGQLVLHTGDNAAIDASYSGIARFPNPLVSFFDLKKPPGPRHGEVFINIGFDTADQRYSWLDDRQCIAFGTIDLSWHEPDGADLVSISTFDIYSGG